MQKVFRNPVIETLPRREIEEAQTKFLKRQIGYVYSNSAFYRGKFDEAKVKPDDIKTIEDFKKKLPVTTRIEIEENAKKTGDPYGGTRSYPEGVVQPVCTYQIFKGIPEGKPIYVASTVRDHSNLIEHFVRQWRMIGIEKGDVVVYDYQAISGDHLNLVRTGSIAQRPDVSEILGCIPLCIISDIVITEAPRTIHYAKFFKPRVLFAPASFLPFVEDILKREGKSPQELGFQIIVIRDREGKETLKAEQREKVEGTWGARVQNMLSVPENSFYAMDCAEKSGLHIWEDAFLVEALDERNELVTPGGIGKLTITNLFAEGTPLLRYKTNIDVILNEEVCKCGRTHLRMSYPE